MKIVAITDGHITIEMTRRNLKALMAKLDGHPPDSACAIWKYEQGVVVTVKAVEDAVHYDDRVPGEMVMETEMRIVDSDV